jgi:hypothetical protein
MLGGSLDDQVMLGGADEVKGAGAHLDSGEYCVPDDDSSIENASEANDEEINIKGKNPVAVDKTTPSFIAGILDSSSLQAFHPRQRINTLTSFISKSKALLLMTMMISAVIARFCLHPGATTMQSQEQKTKDIIANIPAIITPSRLNVICSRGFYCNISSCAPLQLRSPTVSHSYQDMISYLSGKNRTASSRNLRIQYWGDSIQATMECDMRQWLLEIEWLLESTSSLESSPVNISATISSGYIKIGCPWHCDPPQEYWEDLKLSYNTTDVLVFNIGSHYEEFGNIESIFRNEILERYYEILHSFLMLEKKILLIRGPSATHFDTENGLANETQRESLTQMFDDSNSTYAYCSPLRKVPDVVSAQEQVLSMLVDRLQSSVARSKSSSVAYMDVYEMTKDRYSEHTTIRLKPLDCKHFCQNCGVLRTWNAMVVDYLMRM